MRSCLLLCAVVATFGCTERASQSPGAQAARKAIVLEHAPRPQHTLDIRWDGKMRLLGYDLSEAHARLQQPLQVTWYWQVDAPLPTGYQVFTHLSDGRMNRVNLDNDRALRRFYPEAHWKKGDFLKDVQGVTLPSDWGSKLAVFYVGFYSGSTRLPITAGPHDAQRRAIALRLPVEGARVAPPTPGLPRLLARRLEHPITIDGKLDEPDWHAAQSTGPFVNTLTGGPGAFAARAQVLYDDQRLYFAFVVDDDYLKSTFDHDDDHLWEQDTVEVMLDPDGDGRNYFELQVSPRGVHFDTRYDAPRDPRPFGHVDWDSQVQAKVQLNGKPNDEQPDRGYVVEFSVPFRALAVGAPAVAPPRPGSTWRMNFFVMDARRRGQRAVGWSAPRVGDFHTLDKFGRVVFMEAASPAAAPAKPAAGPASKPSQPTKR